MKIAVIGGGSAGFLAAAHITKNFPSFELYHIFDSRIPTIGVGEGTLPAFRFWLYELTGMNFTQLVEKCHITRKFGILFENWGTKRQKFMHNFRPLWLDYGIHFSAPTLVEVLQDHVGGTRIDKKVINVNSDGVSAQIQFEDDTQLEVDFVFDASGFPKKFDHRYQEISLIPTNSALIHRGPVSEYQLATRSVARPHGWMFVIPLATDTAYGYLYNSSINSKADIEADFEEFRKEEKTEFFNTEKQLTFPTFTCLEPFDGAVFKIGNAASFLEPLEATAIQVLQHQIAIATAYPLKYLAQLEQFSKVSKRTKFSPNYIHKINDHLVKYVLQLSIFVSWHYINGSRFDTEFWRFAQNNYQEGVEKLGRPDLVSQFEQYLNAGSKFLDTLDFPSRVDMYETPEGALFPRNFGGYSEESFAEVGHGIGYF